MTVTQIKPSQLEPFLVKSIKKRCPILIVGKPGIGKTAIISQVAKRLKYEVENLYPAISDPTLFMGMPYYNPDEHSADFLPFGQMRRIIEAKKETICFLDDIGQSEISVMKALMSFVQARQIGTQKLSDLVTIIGCTNDRSHNAGVVGMIEPLKSRFLTILHLQVDVEDWIRWAILNNIRPEIIGFVRLKGMEVLSSFTPTMDFTNSPSPRGNERVSEILNLGIEDPAAELAAIEGTCGQGYAVEFAGFKKLFDSLVDPKYILKHPEDVEIPQSNPSVLFAYCSALSRMADPDTMDAIVKFARRLPVEFAVKLLKFDCFSADPANHETAAYTGWAIDNKGAFTN
jgi:hypothetical protein